MPPLSAALRAHMLKATGQPVVFGARASHGVFVTEPLEVVTEGGLEISGIRTTLDIAADDPAFAGLAVDSALTVAGAPYVVRLLGRVRADGMRTLYLAEGV